MYNPYEVLLQEIQGLKTDLAVVLNRIPKEQSIVYHSPKDLSENTPLGIQTIRRKIKSGDIFAKKVGRKYLIPTDEFNRICKDVKSVKYKRS